MGLIDNWLLTSKTPTNATVPDWTIEDGILRDLGLCIDGLDQLPPVYRFVATPCLKAE